MIPFSSLNPPVRRLLPWSLKNVPQRNWMSHNTFPYAPSRFQWTKFKDMFNLYLLVGAIPLAITIAYAHIFIGPATLSEIPKDYVPKHWEYYQNPITRFLAKYIHNTPQQDYEKYLHHIFEEEEKRRIRRLEKEVKRLMKERLDYKAYYYRPVLAKYHRRSRKVADYLEDISGD